MIFVKRCVTVLAGLMLSCSILAAQVDVAGIKLADRIELNGTKLQLNGAGIRYKSIFKVYVAALYLEKKATTPEEVYAATGPKRVSITMLRKTDSAGLGKSFTRAFEENSTKEEMSKLIPGLIKLGEIFSDQRKMGPGESLTIDWIPGKGAVISNNGQPQRDPIKEVEFYNAMLRIWLGANPADEKLKEEILGKTR